MNQPLLSVLIPTYNHALYIAQAIDGVLSQKTNFNFEILVGEDDSSDGTREICKAYAENFPDKIRLFLNDRKNVIYMGGKPTGRWNFINLWNNSKGKYIAICDGDDYWRDPCKLQKQIDFLESNPAYNLSFHNAIVEFDDPDRKAMAYSNFPWNKIETNRDVYTIHDLVASPLCPTASVVFRRPDNFSLPGWFSTVPSGDMALLLLVCGDGKAKYFDEYWSVYRKLQKGITASHKGDFIHAGRIFMYLRILEHYQGAYADSIKDVIASHLEQLISLATISEADQKKLASLLPQNTRIQDLGSPNNSGQRTKVTFVANGPNQINGPNVWLQRILPELSKRGFEPRVIFSMVSGDECEVMNNLRCQGIKCIKLRREKYTEQNIVNLLTVIKADPPDVFVPNLNVAGYYAARWVKAAGIPTIGILHSDDNFYHELSDTFVAGQQDYRLSGIVCVSEFIEKMVRDKHIANVNILKCPYGIELPKEKAGVVDGRLKLVFTGRLIQRQKRIFDVIYALQKAVKDIPGTTATLYGEDREGGKAIHMINQYGLAGRLNYGGLLKYEEIFSTLVDHHAFVLLSDYEGMSISLMEAMGCGLVPICTQTRSGAGEIIEHDVNGLLVNDRGEDFFNAVKRLRTEEGLFERLARAARETIKNGYTLDICADRWEGFLRAELSKTGIRGEIKIPDTGSIDLPAVSETVDGICREDVRMPKTTANKKNMILNDQHAVLRPNSAHEGSAFTRDRTHLPLVNGEKANAVGKNQIGQMSSSHAEKKKIIIIQGGFPSVSATFILDQMVGLIKQGYEIENWASYNTYARTIHAEIVEHDLLSKTKYLQFPPYRLRSNVAQWVQAFLGMNGIRDLSAVHAFHVHYGAIFNQLEPLFLTLSQPLLVSFHGYDASRYFKEHGDQCYNALFKRADGITTPSDHMKNELVKRGCGPKKITIHRYGIDLERFKCPDRVYRKDNVVFLTVGRFVEKKGIEYSLLAFIKIASQCDCEYRIIGDGELFEKYKQIIDSAGIQSKVKFLGPQPKDRVVAEMKNADVFVLTSVTASDGDCEGVPVALTEAHAAGLPVVSTYHSGIPELVKENHTGLLSAEKDVGAIAANMLKLATDPILRKVFSQNAVERVKDEFNILTLNQKLAGYLGIEKRVLPLDHLQSALARRNWESKFKIYSDCFQGIEFLNKVVTPAISVIVISWRLHPDNLKSFKILEKQRDQNFELIFVDNGAVPGEFDPLKPYIDTYVRLNTNTGAYLARNVGALFAQAPILFFLEDDGIPADNLIKAHREAHAKYDVIAVRGVYHFKNNTNPFNKLAHHYYLGDLPYPRYSDLEGNSSYRAKHFFAVGGWDDEIIFGGGGIELAIRLMSSEPDMHKQIYSPEPVIYHDYVTDEAHLQAKRKKQNKSFARLRQKHPIFDSFQHAWNRYIGHHELIPRRMDVPEAAVSHVATLRDSLLSGIYSSYLSGDIRQAEKMMGTYQHQMKQGI